MTHFSSILTATIMVGMVFHGIIVHGFSLPLASTIKAVSQRRVRVHQPHFPIHHGHDVRGSSTALFSSKTKQQKQNQAQRRGNQQQVGTDGSGDAFDRINYPLVLSNILNQALIGITIWTGGQSYQVLTSTATFNNEAFTAGIVGFLPLLALSSFIESSESSAVGGLNLSTNMAVLRMFGATPKPLQVNVLAATMAILTGFVEETLFRGQAIPFLARTVGGDGDNVIAGVVLSTFLFAFLHTNPIAFFKGKDAASDNAVLFAYQSLTGAVFCLLYLSTGNLAVPIITHALYDFYTFVKVHLVDVAGQVEYAKQNSMFPGYKNMSAANKWSQERGADFVKGVQEAFYLMDTNRDGVLSRKELRVGLYSYGINLSQAESQQVLQTVDADQQGDIDLDEFLAFVAPAGNANKAVRNTLLGPM